MAKTNRFEQRGFSLAELMIAIGILGVGLLMIAGAFPVGLDQTRQGVELLTSQRVFNEAITTLRTRVDPMELEEYIDIDNNITSWFGAAESDYWLNPTSLAPPIFLLSFNPVLTDTGGSYDFFSACENDDSLYSQDPSYGWLAAAEQISSRCYKFTIFILREPTGMETSSNNLKFQWSPPITVTPDPPPSGVPAAPTNKLDFSPASPPERKTIFLGNNQIIYKTVEVNPENNRVRCDGQVSDGNTDSKTTEDVNQVAYPVEIPSAGRTTRPVPTVAVYQTIISY